MERLTTDTPNGNFETMINFVHGKEGWAHIYDADGKEVNLITWAINHCHDRGCDDLQCKTLEEYDEVLSSCMMDYMDCPIAMAYCFASQAIHLRSRLKMYEDTMPLERAQELAQAEKGGRLLILPDTKYTDAVTRITGSHDTADATAEKPALYSAKESRRIEKKDNA